MKPTRPGTRTVAKWVLILSLVMVPSLAWGQKKPERARSGGAFRSCSGLTSCSCRIASQRWRGVHRRPFDRRDHGQPFQRNDYSEPRQRNDHGESLQRRDDSQSFHRRDDGQQGRDDYNCQQDYDHHCDRQQNYHHNGEQGRDDHDR